MAHRSFDEVNEKVELNSNNGNGGNYSYDPTPEMKTCVVKAGDAKAIRWKGEVPGYNDKIGDPVEVLTSWVRTSDGKMRQIIWSNDETHPLYELQKTCLGSYSYNKELKKKIYENEGKFETFGIWMQPNPDPSKKGSMSPTKNLLINVIDRSDSWCKDNKHTKVLCWGSSKSVDDKGVEREYPSWGIRYSAFDTLWTNICKVAKLHPEDTDFVIHHFKKDEQPNNFTTCAWHLPEEKTILTTLGSKINRDFSNLSSSPMGAEEESYESYDFTDIPFVSRPTSCTQLIKLIGWLIKKCDAEHGTNLYEKFQARATVEKEEWAKKHPKEENKETVESTPTNNVVENKVETSTPNFDTMKTVESSNDEELPNFEPPVKRMTRTPVTTKKFVIDEELFPASTEMTEKEKSFVVGMDENGKLLYADGTTQSECSECHEIGLMEISICPYCGTRFDKPNV